MYFYITYTIIKKIYYVDRLFFFLRFFSELYNMYTKKTFTVIVSLALHFKYPNISQQFLIQSVNIIYREIQIYSVTYIVNIIQYCTLNLCTKLKKKLNNSVCSLWVIIFFKVHFNINS